MFFDLLHRTTMPVFRLGGRRLERPFWYYRHAWRRFARHQRGKTYFGASVECDLKDRIPEFIFHFGHWEPNNSYWIGQRLHQADVFVDVGANLGYYSLLASRIVGRHGKVVAVEASPRIFRRLQSNLKTNDCTNVRAVNVAVSAVPGRVTIYAGPAQNTGATSVLPGWRGGSAEAEVEALPLDQILTSEELANVRLIKIDVEGAEVPILEQLVANIDKYPSHVEILVECSRIGDQQSTEWDDLLGKILGAGFSAFAIENDYSAGWYLQWRRPCALRPIGDLPEGQTDVLFTRDPALASLGRGERTTSW